MMLASILINFIKIIYYDKSILSFNETLEFMNVSKSFLYKLTSKREIKFYKPNNGKLYFKVTDLEEWMLRNEKYLNMI